MYCINSETGDNGHHLLTFYVLVEVFDLASAVLLGARFLEAPILPLFKSNLSCSEQ
jgi:hypothetical protein